MSSVTGDSATTSKIRKPSDGASVASAPAPDLGPDLGRSSPSIVSSIDTEEAGARLSAVTLDDSPSSDRDASPRPRIGFGQSYDIPSSRPTALDASRFQVGDTPSGDVFISPVKESVPGHYVGQSPARGNGVGHGPATPSHPLRTRSSNLSGRHFIGGVDAQGIYPPSACVFVANLPEPKDDRALEAAVTREFSKYGTVFVKIRRDSHHMPFAFCQYTKDEDAREAMVRGKGAMILGRACRTEMVRANRTFIVHKRYGGEITVDEARSLLEPYGPINKAEFLHTQLQEMLGLPLTVIAEFALYDPGRDLQTAFRYNDEYRVDLFDLKKTMPSTRANADENYLAQYEMDRRSVFVSGFGPHVSQAELTALFSEFGEVVNVQLIRKFANNSVIPRVFAFIEYERPDLPDEAIANLHGKEFEGACLRVERKVMKEPTPRRVRSQYMAKPNMGSNTGGVPTTPERPNMRAPSMTQQPGTEQTAPVVTEAAPPPWGWPYGTQPFTSPTYVAQASPPYSIPTGASSMSMSPQATANSMQPYAYYGNYWTGMPFVQDPMLPAGMPFYGFSSPSAYEVPRQSDDILTTPTRPQHTPTPRVKKENVSKTEKA